MTVEGIRELVAKLEALSGPEKTEAIRAALGDGAESIRARASNLVRHAPGAPDIADHMVVSFARRQHPDDAVAISVGPSTDTRSDQPKRRFDVQGFFLEYGTVKMPAFPFLRPALDSEGDAAADTILRRLQAWFEGR